MAIERMLSEETPARVLVARVLAEAGIEYVFGISGGHTGRIVSGLGQVQNQVRMVTGARGIVWPGVMAEVYGRLTRRPGVMLGQGPWVLGNGLIGTLEAYLSWSPMLLLTDFSDAPHFRLHAPYQQATGDYGSWDARRAFGGVTKQVMQAHEPIAAVQATQLAIKHAMAGQPGPVAVLFSHDSLAGTVAPGLAAARSTRPAIICRRRRRPPSRRRSRLQLPSASSPRSKPVLIAGNGVRIAQAYEELQQARRDGRAAGRRRRPPARASLPKPIRWRSASSAPSARRRRTPASAKPIWCWSLGSKLSPSDTAWDNRKLLDPTRQSFIQIDIEPRNASWNYPGRARRARRCRDRPGPARRGGAARAAGRAGRRRSAGSPAIASATAISTTPPISPTTCRSCRSG